MAFWSRHDIVGGSVSLGTGFEVPNAQVTPESLFLLPADPAVKLPVTL